MRRVECKTSRRQSASHLTSSRRLMNGMIHRHQKNNTQSSRWLLKWKKKSNDRKKKLSSSDDDWWSSVVESSQKSKEWKNKKKQFSKFRMRLVSGFWAVLCWLNESMYAFVVYFAFRKETGFLTRLKINHKRKLFAAAKKQCGSVVILPGQGMVFLLLVGLYCVPTMDDSLIDSLEKQRTVAPTTTRQQHKQVVVTGCRCWEGFPVTVHVFPETHLID